MDFGLLVFLVFITNCACSGLAAAVGDARNAKYECGVLGFIFGPLGLIASLGFDRRPICPNCGTPWNGHPRICPGCEKRISWDTNRAIPHATLYEDLAPPPPQPPPLLR